VYPENVTVALEQPPASAWCTGRFVLRVGSDADEDRYLSVVVEVAPGVDADPTRAATLADGIRTALLRLNSEYANYVPVDRQTPRVELRPTNDPEYFPPGVKHRYTRPS
jgi:phenylacetate-CoA ligase